ncbi:MAG: leucine-rich repeat domain-containing protein [Ruminococcus sp.]|nr:leucine-rich repeat domain-containing protein [Ruminococcus sp.]
MTKLEKIEEIIREYENSSDANVTAEDIIQGIKNTLDADDRYFDLDRNPTRTAPSDEIDFDKELIFDSLSLESEYFGYSAEPHFESENSISWALTVNSSLERLFIERGGYDKDEFAISVGDEYVEGLNPLDYDDIYAEHYLIIDKGKNINIENQIKRSGTEITTCYDTVLSPSESAALCRYIDKYLAQFNGRSIDSYLAESREVSNSKFEIKFCELVKYHGNEEHVVVPEGVDQLGKYVFSDCADIKSVKLPEGLKFINESAFADCTNLESVTLPNTLEYIGNGAFLNCKNLKEITIPDSVERIGVYAFSGCDNLKNTSIPQGCDVDINAFQRHHNVTRRNSDPKQSRSIKI